MMIGGGIAPAKGRAGQAGRGRAERGRAGLCRGRAK